MKFTKQGIALPKLKFTTEHFSFLMKELHPKKWGMAVWCFVLLSLLLLSGFLMVDDYSEATTIHTYSFVVFGHSFYTFDDSSKLENIRSVPLIVSVAWLPYFLVLFTCVVLPIFGVWATFYNESLV